MNLYHQIPIGLRRIGKGFVAQDARVADQDVDLAVMIQGGLGDIFATGHGGDIIAVGHGLAAGCDDLIDYFLRGGTRAVAGSIAGPAEVIDHNRCTFFGEELGIGLAQATTGAGNDGDLTVQKTHDLAPNPLLL